MPAVAVLVLEVDEPAEAGERSEIPVVDLELAGHLGGVADDAAVVVAPAVVGVGAGQAVVALAGAPGHAVGEGGVEAPLNLAGTELDRLRRQGVQEPSGGKGADRQAEGLADGAARGRPAGEGAPTGRRVRPGRSVRMHCVHECSPWFSPCRGIGGGGVSASRSWPRRGPPGGSASWSGTIRGSCRMRDAGRSRFLRRPASPGAFRIMRLSVHRCNVVVTHFRHRIQERAHDRQGDGARGAANGRSIETMTNVFIDRAGGHDRAADPRAARATRRRDAHRDPRGVAQGPGCAPPVSQRGRRRGALPARRGGARGGGPGVERPGAGARCEHRASGRGRLGVRAARARSATAREESGRPRGSATRAATRPGSCFSSARSWMRRLFPRTRLCRAMRSRDTPAAGGGSSSATRRGARSARTRPGPCGRTRSRSTTSICRRWRSIRASAGRRCSRRWWGTSRRGCSRWCRCTPPRWAKAPPWRRRTPALRRATATSLASRCFRPEPKTPSTPVFSTRSRPTARDRIDLFVFGDGSRILLAARLDNLGKGASGAAVQNLNLMIGADEFAGLTL